MIDSASPIWVSSSQREGEARSEENLMRFIMLSECATNPGETQHRRYRDMIEEAVIAEEMASTAGERPSTTSSTT
jgi:hypothetical protein